MQKQVYPCAVCGKTNILVQLSTKLEAPEYSNTSYTVKTDYQLRNLPDQRSSRFQRM